MEFRVTGARNISNKLRVRSLTGLKKLNYQKTFETLVAKLIEKHNPPEAPLKDAVQHAEIDFDKVHKIEFGLHGNTNLKKHIERLKMPFKSMRDRLRFAMKESYGRIYCFSTLV